MTIGTILPLIHAGICAFCGYSAFFAFLILKNYPSAVLGLISAITDSISFFLHYLCRKGNLRQWYDRTDLRIICRYSIIIATVGLLSLGYFTTIQIMLKKPILPIPDSCVISIVWSIVAMRSGLTLMISTMRYQRNELESDPRLLNETPSQATVEAQEESSPETNFAAPSDQS